MSGMGNSAPNVNLEGQKATYTLSVSIQTMAGGVLQIAAGAKTVRITHVWVNPGVATAAATQNVNLQVCTAAATGGASSSVTPLAHDSNDPATTVTAIKYTAAPSSGGGTIWNMNGLGTAGTTPAAGQPIERFWGNRGGAQCPVVRPTQFFQVNLSPASIAGQLGNIEIEWTEE